jgi:hypothetical protein
MVVDEIVTSLKNAVDHGESVESASTMLINSGYSPADVNEAAQLLGGGAISYLQPKPSEQLSTPAQKNLISGKPVAAPTQVQPIQRPAQAQPQQIQQQRQVQPIQRPGQFQQQSNPQLNTKLQSNLPLQQNTPIAIQSVQEVAPPVQQINDQKDAIRQDSSAIKQNISSGAVYSSSPNSLSNELSQITPRKESYIKEIILLIVLLLLIGVLIGTFLLKDTILSFLSGF